MDIVFLFLPILIVLFFKAKLMTLNEWLYTAEYSCYNLALLYIFHIPENSRTGALFLALPCLLYFMVIYPDFFNLEEREHHLVIFAFPMMIVLLVIFLKFVID